MTPTWSGPFGPAFAALVRERLQGVAGVEIDVRRIDPNISTHGSYLVDAGWSDGGVPTEVADSIEEVRVMDEYAEDVGAEVALRYIAARAAGMTKSASWVEAGR
ncbi:hypothetical protein [Oryzobacter telluris]|uniref:hypothetical protein n=1 Tax=Oryzobacter telluris TaxID=3149179 RepID=UPI00370D47FE